jgi:predicted nucleotidyltransferase
MLKEKFEELQIRLLSEIKSYYKKRLVSVVIFGSVARGTFGFDSDLDVLIIARRLPRGRMRRAKEFEIVEKKLDPFLKSLSDAGINTFLSVVFKTPAEAQKGSPLFLDMVEDARILFDQEGFFANILETLRGKLKKLGAKRVWKANSWYWILNPNLKPGEIIEL